MCLLTISLRYVNDSFCSYCYILLLARLRSETSAAFVNTLYSFQTSLLSCVFRIMKISSEGWCVRNSIISLPGILRIPTGTTRVESIFPRQCPSAPRCTCTPATGQFLISILLQFLPLAQLPSPFPPNMSQSFSRAVWPQPPEQQFPSHFTQHLPSHPTPDSCPTAPFAGGTAPCSTALLSLKQIQCILFLLEAVVRGETFQCA